MRDDDVPITQNDVAPGFTFRPFRKEDYITKTTAVGARNRPTPLWDKFLDKVVPDLEVRGFLYRFFGYCLTGDTSEECFVFLYGSGQNGKGTYLGAIRAIWGQLAATASVDLLTRKQHEKHSEELAQLRAVRLVIADETERGTTWDEARLKAMVSGERIRACYKFKDSFEFKPKFKIAVSGNNKPTIVSVDKAIRRRILLVPFLVEIPDDEKNTKLKEDLVGEYPGILYKFMIGLQDYWRTGLNVPRVIEAATEEYMEEEDSVGCWLDERELVSRNPNDRASIDLLFGDWSVWAGNAGETRGSKKALNQALKARGFKYFREANRRGFLGLKVQPPPRRPNQDASFDDYGLMSR